jgi:hypothetical protein
MVQIADFLVSYTSLTRSRQKFVEDATRRARPNKANSAKAVKAKFRDYL